MTQNAPDTTAHSVMFREFNARLAFYSRKFGPGNGV